MVKVLHSVGAFLPVTQNWIYPQVSGVPCVDPAVLCAMVTNCGDYPFFGPKFFTDGIPPGTPIRRALRYVARTLNFSKALVLRQVSAWRPDVLHAHFGTLGWQTVWLKHHLGVPLVTSFYGVEAWQLPVTEPIWLERFGRLFLEGNLFLVEGPAMARRLEAIGCPGEKIRIRHLGVDLDRLHFVERRFSGRLRILMVGRFVEKKGLVEGLSGCLQAARQGIDLEVTIVGAASDNDAAGQHISRHLEELAAVPELRGKVRFAGLLSHSATQAELRMHDLLLCPSKHAALGDAEGGMPFVLAEAMATGMIGVGSDHCDMTELISDDTGYLFPEARPDSIGSILGRIDRNRESLGRMSRAGRAHIEREFDLRRQLDILADIYKALAHGRPKVH